MRKTIKRVSIFLFLLLICFILVSCDGEIEVQADYGISLKASEQKGRYVILDIEFDDSISGNNAAVEARISFENAEVPTLEAFDLFGQVSNDSTGNLRVSEQDVAKVLVYVPKPGDEIRVTIEVDGKTTVIEHATNPSIEFFEVDDGFYEGVRRKLITTPYFNALTDVHIPSEGIHIWNGVLTEGALRGVSWSLSGRYVGGATVEDITKPNEYTVFSLSGSEVEEFRRRLTTFIDPYWVHAYITTKKMDANIRFGTFVSLEQYLYYADTELAYTGPAFNFRNTYINNNVHVEYKINVDGTEEFNLSIREEEKFFVYFNKEGNNYSPSYLQIINNGMGTSYFFDEGAFCKMSGHCKSTCLV